MSTRPPARLRAARARTAVRALAHDARSRAGRDLDLLAGASAVDSQFPALLADGAVERWLAGHLSSFDLLSCANLPPATAAAAAGELDQVRSSVWRRGARAARGTDPDEVLRHISALQTQLETCTDPAARLRLAEALAAAQQLRRQPNPTSLSALHVASRAVWARTSPSR